jgi:aldehyde dehydrogenase (NAD+)
MDNILLPMQQMQQYFLSGNTRSYGFRKQQLQQLKAALYKYEQEIYKALYTDLKKNPEECWVTEIGFVVSEINFALKKLRKWMKPVKAGTNLLNFPGKSYVLHEPLGVVLIISPWNYPFQLLLTPLVGAIAAGNCAVLKPSEFAPATAMLIQKIIAEVFDPAYITVVQGDGAAIIPQLMNNFRFDHVFYTGSTQVGSIIYQMAARQLVPVTLELGGKSPCLVESDADINVTARRIAFTKFSNAGQMCVAPDYVLVHQRVKDALITELKKNIEDFYQAEKMREYHYGKIVNEKQFHRLTAYLKQGTVVYGGGYDVAQLYIEPTLLTDVPSEAAVMSEEIFGPVLPIIAWQNETEVYELISKHNNPLAFYVFTTNKAKAAQWIRSLSFGGGCINNAGWHLTNYHLPFGGTGSSGMGSYHGRYSFETFSHKKAIMDTPLWFDPSLKYPPLKGKLSLFKKIIR